MDDQAAPCPPKRIWAFLGLVALLSLPLWLLARGQILPGLPVAAIMVLCPAAAALTLTAYDQGVDGVRRLLARILDVQGMSGRSWLIPVLPFVVAILVFLILRAAGEEVPGPSVTAPGLALLLVLFLPGAVAEELGWTGYAMAPMTARFGTFGAGVLLGLVWAIWHYPALIAVGRAPAWIAWWTLGTVAMRLIMVQACRHAGLGLAGAILFHAASNLAWQLFPVQGSWFDPRLHGLLMAASALVLSVAWRRRA